MASFINHEAEESDNSDKEEGAPVKKKKRVIDSDEEDEDEEDGLDDEQKIQEEMKGFVVSGDEEEEEPDVGKEDESDGEEEEMEEDDLALVQENLGIQVNRKKPTRVRLASDDEDEPDDRSRIRNHLFGGETQHDAEAPSTSHHIVDAGASSGSEEDEDEDRGMEDFIAPDEGAPVAPRRQKQRGMPFSEEALRDAQDIFGSDFQDWFLSGEGDEEEEMEEGEGEDMDREEGEDGEFARAVRRKKKSTKQSLLQHIEPEELERGFLSEFDKRVQLEDKPERFQLRRVPVTEAEADEMVAEAEWIYFNAFTSNTISSQEDPIDQTVKDHEKTCMKIKEALNFMRNQHFEVPFIAFYRKEYVEPELSINDLWKVYFWDEKWCQLQLRKKNLITVVKKMKEWHLEQMGENEEALPDDVRVVKQDDVDSVFHVSDTEELQDAIAHFTLYHGPSIPRMQAHERQKKLAEKEDDDHEESDVALAKYATRKDKYSICVNEGLGGFAAKFGLTPAQFAQNLELGTDRFEVEQYPVSPQETAHDYFTGQFETAEKIMEAAKFMVAKQISVEPTVRSILRKEFRRWAFLTVKPTKKGKKEIDENHPVFTLKYIDGKPINSLTKDEFIKLIQAEESKLVTLSISADPKNTDEQRKSTFAEKTIDKNLFRKDEYNQNAQDWNELRDATLLYCIEKILTPMFVKEIRCKLIQESREYVVKECCLRLYNWLKIGQYIPEDLDAGEDAEVHDGVRVLSIAYTPERDQAAFCCIVDGDGQVVDHLRLVHFTKTKFSRKQEDRVLKEADINSLKDFIRRKKPHVIALAADNLDALNLQKDVQTLISDMMEHGDMSNKIEVELVDNELAKVYQNSKTATADFRDFPALLRQGVSLARRLQDPLPEFCQMCTVDDEIMCLSYHPLQDQVPKDDLQSALMLEFINRVNEVGVDINRCLDHPHTSGMLQFVCGLGARKASYLIKLLKQNENLLENRTKLVTLCRMGPKVFMNCAGFIKIDTVKVADKTDAYVEVLDGSRVHPETYEWARKMAVDALEYDDTAEDANPASALEEILEAPERLKDLDLDAFAEELARQGFGNKSITLYDIRAELNKRYKDLRQAYRTPLKEDIFNMLTKETPQTFNVGKLVMGRVLHVVCKRPRDDMEHPNPVKDDTLGIWQCPLCHKNDFAELSDVWVHFDSKSCPGQAVGVKVRLENGINGFIPIKYLSDKPVTDPNERVASGMPVYCRVLKVDTDRFQAELSCRSSDLIDHEGTFKNKIDQYYNLDEEKKDKAAEEELRNKKDKQTYLKRVIAHPHFANIGYRDTEKRLENMQIGDCIIRPSSKGNNFLTLTWKVTDKVYQNVSIEEENKEKAFTLGKLLKIGNEEFEDLDEIIARYVTPMASNAREIISFKYYLGHPEEGEPYTLEQIGEVLADEKSTSRQNHIPYKFTVARSPLPKGQERLVVGKFMLSYMPRSLHKYEFVSVTPTGFRFRGQNFRFLGEVLKWFKVHFREPPPGPVGTPGDQQSTHGQQMTPFDAMSRVSHTPKSSGGWNRNSGAPPMGYPNQTPMSNSGHQQYVAPPESVAGSSRRGWEANSSEANRRTPKGGQDWADAARNWASHRQ